jgi:hypothetical protein
VRAPHLGEGLAELGSTSPSAPLRRRPCLRAPPASRVAADKWRLTGPDVTRPDNGRPVSAREPVAGPLRPTAASTSGAVVARKAATRVRSHGTSTSRGGAPFASREGLRSSEETEGGQYATV